MPRRDLRWTFAPLGVLLLIGLWVALRSPDSPPAPDDAPSGPAAIATIDAAVAALAPQRPGHPDLYVLGIAGDGTEVVFLNEVRHLRALAALRLDAGDRVLLLANHPPAPPRDSPPPATPRTIRHALAALGRAMDRDEDILLLYVTTHGTEGHQLLLRRPDRPDHLLDPRRLREALDDAGIRHRVVVLSACYAGGFARTLATPDTLFLAAARADRPSFGCGVDSRVTFFGKAWLVDGLNSTVDFAEAFRRARAAIGMREAFGDYAPSRPQMREGARIGRTLAAWRATFTPGPPVPFAFDAPDAGKPVTVRATEKRVSGD